MSRRDTFLLILLLAAVIAGIVGGGISNSSYICCSSCFSPLPANRIATQISNHFEPSHRVAALFISSSMAGERRAVHEYERHRYQ